MKLEITDFLKGYLARHPELRRTIRTDPPSALWKKNWKPIDHLRLLSSGIQLHLSGGVRIRIAPDKGKSSQRSRWAARILKLLRQHFRGWKVVQVLKGTDRTRHQTAAFLRILFWDGQGCVAALVVYPGEPGKLADRLFSAALLWWDRLQSRIKIKRVLIFLPESFGELFVGRFPNVKIPMVCYKFDLSRSALRQVYPRPVGSSRLRFPYVIFPHTQNAPLLLEQMKVSHPLLDLSYRKARWQVSYLGLRIAWYSEDRRQCLFDLRNPRALNFSGSDEFEAHLEEVIHFRSFPPPHPDHLFYRFGHERWLESLILKNHTLLNPDFCQLVYPQVPTCLDGERKVLDLLTATTAGQVAVLELKVHQDLDLLFQGLDYWDRVAYHVSRGDFQRAGYFEGMPLSRELPLLYLVCPLFEFHRVMPALRRHLSDEVAVQCAGINANWKGGVKVLRRFGF